MYVDDHTNIHKLYCIVHNMFMYGAHSLAVGSCYSSSKSRTRTGEQASEGE